MSSKKKKERKPQDFSKFGRLNSKKLNKLFSEKEPLYDIQEFFPYLTTRSKSMDQRHTISSFKTMIKSYKYCYSLNKEFCVAMINRNWAPKTPGIKKEEKCVEIDTDVYVFTNIAVDDFVLDHTWDLLWNRDERISLKYLQGDDCTTDIRLFNVLNNLQQTKSKSKYSKLETYISEIDLINLNSKVLNNEDVDEALFNEFIWKVFLDGSGIYSYKNLKETKKKTENELKEENERLILNIDIKRAKIKPQDKFSLLKYFNRYGALEYVASFIKELNLLNEYGHTKSSNKLVFDFLEKQFASFHFETQITPDMIFYEARTIIEDSLESLRSIQNNYIFLLNPYSKDYRAFFAKIKNTYSPYYIQQIMKKLRSEYNSLDDKIIRLEKQLKELKDSYSVIKAAIEEYNKSLGDNQLPNEGFGFVGDGWNDDSNEDDAMTQIREEDWWLREQERLEREQEAERDYQELEKRDISNKDNASKVIEKKNKAEEHFESVFGKEEDFKSKKDDKDDLDDIDIDFLGTS